MTPALRDTLERLRNADGGWPYGPGKASRLEPTCWGLLALARASGRPSDLEVLRRWPRRDGWLADVAGAPVNYAFNALAGLTLLSHAAEGPAAREIASLLLTVRGLRLDQSPVIRQDNSLQAWPWIDGTFSWVEPTSWCLLLLKKVKDRLRDSRAEERIRVGDQLLQDRVCGSGGWNYGGSNVYGQELYPYVPTTAIGLLALQDQRADPHVSRSLAWLRQQTTSERSPIALSLAAIALRTYGLPGAQATAPLTAVLGDPRPTDDVVGLAMGLYALAETSDGESVFAL